MFSCEICEILNNTFFYRHFWWLLLKSKKFNFHCFLVWLPFCLKHVALQIIQVSFASNGDWKKKQRMEIHLNSTTNSEVSIKIQTMNLALNAFYVKILCVFKLVELFYQSREWSKIYGLVQQLILLMLRDLILQSHDRIRWMEIRLNEKS